MDIYQSGEYIDKNPTLHDEDASFKVNNIINIFESSIDLKQKKKIKILDIGGGNGSVGFLFSQYLKEKRYEFEFHAIDMSEEMLKIQKKCNPFLKQIFFGDIKNLNDKYDLVLLIDVIEHIEDYKIFTNNLKEISSYAIYNIPIEKNLFDLFRNFYFKGKYYKNQFTTLGHVNFFSFKSAIFYLNSNFKLLNYKFVPYANHILKSNFHEYISQRKSKIRLAELKISKFISKYFKIISPYVIQGSLYSLSKIKK